MFNSTSYTSTSACRTEPRSVCIMLSGEPGAGKTTLAMQFLLEGMRPIRQTHESISDSEARAKVSLPTMSTQAIAGLRILVVDDELDARVLVRRLLNERGAEALLTGSVAEALQVLSSTSVDVLISDIGMPSEDGYSLIRRVRQLPGEGSRIPAVALTAYARVEDREKILQSGFQEHLAKPVDAGELLSVIARLGGKPSVG